jgi:small conductance mechanosensitive channel
MKETNPEGANKIGKLIWNITFYVLVIFAFFISFEIMWMNIWLLISWVSLWLWLAFKEILGNMFAGMMILYTKEFKMWDIIEIQSDQTYFGRIEEITIRYTVIRTLDLRQVVIPNMTMISKPIKTFSSENIVKLNTTVWIHYDSDVAKAINVITEAINSFNFVQDKENTTVYVTNFGESAIDLKCIFGFDPKCGIIWDFAVWYINEKISDEFNKNGIKIPYNHATLTFDDWFEKDKKSVVPTKPE